MYRENIRKNGRFTLYVKLYLNDTYLIDLQACTCNLVDVIPSSLRRQLGKFAMFNNIDLPLTFVLFNDNVHLLIDTIMNFLLL